MIQSQLKLEKDLRKAQKLQKGVIDDFEEQEGGTYKSQFQSVLNNLKTRGDKFTDPEFMPGPSSLIEDWNDKSKEIREITDEWKEFKWIRASQIPLFATGDKND